MHQSMHIIPTLLPIFNIFEVDLASLISFILSNGCCCHSVTNFIGTSTYNQGPKQIRLKATFCCYHHSSVSLFSFHIKMITAVYLQNDSSWVMWIADSAQMSNKRITAFYLQNDSSISLDRMIIQVKCCYERKIVKHCNDDNSKTLLSSYLLWPIVCVGLGQEILRGLVN